MQGVEKVEGIVLIYIVGLHFLQENLSVQDHCIPKGDPIFSFLAEETIVCRGCVLIHVQLSVGNQGP